jgi:hypothetical protein
MAAVRLGSRASSLVLVVEKTAEEDRADENGTIKAVVAGSVSKNTAAATFEKNILKWMNVFVTVEADCCSDQICFEGWRARVYFSLVVYDLSLTDSHCKAESRG